MELLFSFVTALDIVESDIDILWINFNLRSKLYPTINANGKDRTKKNSIWVFMISICYNANSQ